VPIVDNVPFIILSKVCLFVSFLAVIRSLRSAFSLYSFLAVSLLSQQSESFIEIC